MTLWNTLLVPADGHLRLPAVADGPRTTLANIRQRLQMMCGGTLEVAPREGGGTVARVTVPQQG